MVSQTFPLFKGLVASRTDRHALLGVEFPVKYRGYESRQCVSVHLRGVHAEAMLGVKSCFTDVARMCRLQGSWGGDWNVLSLLQDR